MDFNHSAPATALVLVALTGACTHATIINSIPAGASVYLGDDPEPAGVTPYQLYDVSRPVRVEKQGTSAVFKVEEHTDWGYTAANTCAACAASTALLACLGGSIYALGSLLGWTMPVIGPIIAVLGAPPAVCGTLFWSGVGGLTCGAIALPFQAVVGSSVGPYSISVDLDAGTITSDPPGQWRPLEPDAASAPPTDSDPPVPQGPPSRGEEESPQDAEAPPTTTEAPGAADEAVHAF